MTLTASVETESVKQGDTISGTLTATNNSNEAVDITHPNGCDIDYGLYFDGERRTETWGCSDAVVPDELGPGETRVWEFSLPVRGKLTRYDKDGEHEYEPVPPGRYDFFVGINVVGGTWFAPPVAVDVVA